MISLHMVKLKRIPPRANMHYVYSLPSGYKPCDIHQGFGHFIAGSYSTQLYTTTHTIQYMKLFLSYMIKEVGITIINIGSPISILFLENFI